jgi:hypothetical protein
MCIGGFYGDIVGDLRDKGYTVHLPRMGPVSSNWEYVYLLPVTQILHVAGKVSVES